MTNKAANEVFTPTSPARVTFVERSAINDKLVNAMLTPGKQVVVYGPSGSGKTTLLVNKLEQLYEKHVTSRCMKGVAFDHLVLDAFDQLAPYYTSKQSAEQRSTLGAEYAGIKATIDTFGGTTRERILPPQLTPTALGRFLGEARCCWVIEDFHKIAEAEKAKLAQLMKIFMDLADDYPELKIIAIGAVDTARQVVECDSEMRNRVAEIGVPLMSTHEIKEIIAKGVAALNIGLPDPTRNDIAKYSSGVAAVCHQLCLNMCVAAGVNERQEFYRELSREDLELALRQYISDASDSLKSVFDKALRKKRKTKYENAALIIRSLSKYDEEGAIRSALLDAIHQIERRYPASNLDDYLRKLQSDEYGALLRHDTYSGRYSFADPIYRVFALAHFRKSDASAINWIDFEGALSDRLANYFVSTFQSKLNLEHVRPGGKSLSVVYVFDSDHPKLANRRQDDGEPPKEPKP